MSESTRLNKCIFLDRDGVINEERGEYTYRMEDFRLLPGVPEALHTFKAAGYLLIIITNQAGISKGIYTREEMHACHDLLHKSTQHVIDHIYYCPYHPSVTNSLCRKPGTLMIEKALARFHIDPEKSWLAGDAERDITCGLKMGLKTILISAFPDQKTIADYCAPDLLQAARTIILPDEGINRISS